MPTEQFKIRRQRERLHEIRNSQKLPCTYGDEDDRQGFIYEVKDTDFQYLFDVIEKQRQVIMRTQNLLHEKEGFKIIELQTALKIKDQVIQNVTSRLFETRNQIQTILDTPLTDFIELHDAIQDVLKRS